MGISSLRIWIFKSVRDTGILKLGPLNVLIGSNGAGKSNFINFFKFLGKLYEQQIQLYISQNGRAENFLFFDRKTSDFLGGSIEFDGYKGQIEYQFRMVPDQSGNLFFAEEYCHRKLPFISPGIIHPVNIPGNLESMMRETEIFNDELVRSFQSMRLFHFQDTGFNSKMRQSCGTVEYAYLYEDGGNLAAFLFNIQQRFPDRFKVIERMIQSIVPFFDRFLFKPDEIDPTRIYLKWLEKGSEQVFTAHNLSDGTLRMICLTTLLLQPELPDTIIVDEPELGLHPFAINKLAAMLKSASSSTQVIISTQSVNQVDQFDADDIIIVEREKNRTVFKRQSSADLANWLKEYSISELWDKNILAGRSI